MALSVRRAGYHEWLKAEQSGLRQAKEDKENELLMSLKKSKQRIKDTAS